MCGVCVCVSVCEREGTNITIRAMALAIECPVPRHSVVNNSGVVTCAMQRCGR
jgi:hypothetical protein